MTDLARRASADGGVSRRRADPTRGDARFLGKAADPARRVLASYWSLPEQSCSILDGVATRVATDMPSVQTVLSARIRPHAGRPAAFLKMLGRAAGFESEYHGLVTARAATLACLAVRVPAVLHTVEAEHALLTEYVPGARLAEFLRRRYLALPEWAFDAVRDLGRWFAAFHDSSREQVSPEEFADIHRQLVHGYIDTAQSRGRLDRDESAIAHLVLDAIASAVAAQPLGMAWCHADVSLNNVLVLGRTLYVIDFAKSGRHPPERDQLGFWNSLKKEIGALPFSAGARGALWATFLAGYEDASAVGTNASVRDLLNLEDVTHELAYSPSPGRPVSLAAFRRTRLLALATQYLRGWLDDRVQAYGL